MLREEDITIQIESQGYKCESYTVSQNQYSYSRAKAQQRHSGVGYAEAKSMYMTAGA